MNYSSTSYKPLPPRQSERAATPEFPPTRMSYGDNFLVLLGLGLVKFPELKSHWKQDGNDIYFSPIFRRLLAKKRYDEYRENLDFDIEYVEDYLNWAFKERYVPDCVVVIDECLVLFKGRFAGSQHVRGKPHATGLKFYILADKTGYCCSFWLYRGKNFVSKHSAKPKDIVVDFVNSVRTPPEKPVCPSGPVPAEQEIAPDSVVEGLGDDDSSDGDNEASDDDGNYLDEANSDTDVDDSEPSDTKVRISAVQTQPPTPDLLVIGDSYFGSYACAKELNKLQTFFILGTRKNIDQPLKKPLITQLKKHHWRTLYHAEEKIAYCVFNDRALCSFISNFRGGAPSFSKIPSVVEVYNKYMNAVDMFDSSLHLHWNTHRNQKWTYCLQYTLLKMTTVNAWILHSQLTGSKISHTQFLELLLRDDLRRFGKPNKQCYKKMHLVAELGTTGYCVYCPPHSRSKTTFCCTTCDVPLHPKCFLLHRENLQKREAEEKEARRAQLARSAVVTVIAYSATILKFIVACVLFTLIL